MFGMLILFCIALLAIAAAYGICWSFYFHTLTSFSIVGLVVAVVGALYYYDEFYKPRRRQSEPGLVGSYLKARKSKMCPIVTFIEEES